MEATPTRLEVKVSAKTTLRSAFMVLVSAITAGSLVLCNNHGNTGYRGSWVSTLLLICNSDSATASGERLLPIVLMGHKAELHSALGGIEAFVCVRSSPTSFAGSRSWLR